MTNSTLYEKTIDSQYQDGIDTSIILNPNVGFKRKFPFGDDWTEIKLGLFLSYTFSETDNNASQPVINQISLKYNSGGTDNDTFNWVGFIKDNATKYLPDSSLNSDQTFLGIRYNVYNVDARDNYLGKLESLPYFVSGTSNQTGSSINAHLADTTTGNTTNFFRYLKMSVIINSKGTASQSFTFKYEYISNNDIASTVMSDPSLKNLKKIINTNDNFGISSGISTYTWSAPASTTTIPDSFFFYNAFLDIRPRIHAVAVKKIS